MVIKKMLALVLGGLLCMNCFAACSKPAPLLKEKYNDYFNVGVALSKQTLAYYDESILKNFNLVVAENEMKWESIQPSEGVFVFSNADKLIAKAGDLDMQVRGHTLIWHSQTPSWAFAGSYEDAEARMLAHVTKVVTKYKDNISEWDVANEVLSDGDANELFRQDSGWYRACGSNDDKFVEFLAKAYKKVHEIAPDAILFYNDYNLNFPTKRAKAVKLVQKLLAAGAPINAVGMQAHYDIHGLKMTDVENSIIAFKDAGMKVSLTELDLSVYPGDYSGAPYTELSAELDAKQADVYGELFALCRKHKDTVLGVTTWGVADDATWKDNFPVKNRKDFPLLFNVSAQPKSAFQKISNF